MSSLSVAAANFTPSSAVVAPAPVAAAPPAPAAEPVPVAPAAVPAAVSDDDSISEIEPVPMHQKWVFWFDNPRLAPEGSDWKDNLKQCGEFANVADFWAIYNNLKPASKLPLNSNYHVFREGVQPMWEDTANKKGGKFVLTIPKKDSKSGRTDEWWLYTVLSVIGETIDLEGDQICGAVVSIRKSQDRIALWMKSSDKQACSEVGARWKKALELNKTILKYQLHDDAATSGSSFKNETKFEV
jgi:translation initiation factor 4E